MKTLKPIQRRKHYRHATRICLMLRLTFRLTIRAYRKFKIKKMTRTWKKN
jgi:hypothetical protein